MKHSSCVLCSALFLLGPTLAHADLYCAAPVAQAGEVRSGAQLQHIFAFVNRGSEPVEVVQLRPSCGCLTPHLDRMFYEPGSSGSLRLEVNTLTQAAGAETWSVTIRYRTKGEDQELTLYLSGRVVTELTVEPAALEISTSGAFSRTVTLTDSRESPLTVVAVRATSPQMRASLPPPGAEAAGRRTWTVRLDVGDDFPEGRREEWLILSTSDPAYPELKIPVVVDKRPRRSVRVAPEQVELTAAPGQSASRVVLLRATDDEAVEVEGVDCDEPGLHCTWTTGPGLMATLRLTLDAGRLKATEKSSEVRVRLAHPAGETLTVPVTCRMQGS